MGLFNVISAVPVLQIVGAYTAEDCVGGLLTFANAASAYASEGVIKRITVIDADKEKAAGKLYFFNADPSSSVDTDAASFLPAAADLVKLIGAHAVAAADFVDSTSDSVAVYETDLPFVLAAGGTSLFAVFVCTGTPTYTVATDLTIKLLIARD
ncbi:MAG TPA: hypothetical protein VI699_00765 [Candidatus Acidoferrales bacterium]|nr:hypothetical protein [Anaerolineales bacterium]HLE35656.1 hypothetical protein [Candidatus Acidoferrales bacterium]